MCQGRDKVPLASQSSRETGNPPFSAHDEVRSVPESQQRDELHGVEEALPDTYGRCSKICSQCSKLWPLKGGTVVGLFVRGKGLPRARGDVRRSISKIQP